MNDPRILVAGIGNIFLGDDAFGVEVVKRLAAKSLPPGVEVVDFGIRGLDLTYALLGRLRGGDPGRCAFPAAGRRARCTSSSRKRRMPARTTRPNS